MKKFTKAERHKIYKNLLNIDVVDRYSYPHALFKYTNQHVYTWEMARERGKILPEIFLFDNNSGIPHNDNEIIELQQYALMFCIEMTRP